MYFSACYRKARNKVTVHTVIHGNMLPFFTPPSPRLPPPRAMLKNFKNTFPPTLLQGEGGRALASSLQYDYTNHIDRYFIPNLDRSKRNNVRSCLVSLPSSTLRAHSKSTHEKSRTAATAVRGCTAQRLLGSARKTAPSRHRQPCRSAAGLDLPSTFCNESKIS